MTSAPPMRARCSCTPSSSASGTLNCLRTRVVAPTLAWVPFDAATESAGSEMPRPSVRQSISMFQPKPVRSCPQEQRTWSSGMKTDLALDGAVHERRRERIVAVADAEAGVVAVEQAQSVMPSSPLPPRSLCGSFTAMALAERPRRGRGLMFRLLNFA